MRKFETFVIILGIDPGTATTGYGVIKKIKKIPGKKAPKNGVGFECVKHGVIKTSSEHPAATRLNQIYKELNKIIKEHQPTIVVVESLFFFKNLKTALRVSQARGVILMAAARKNLPIFEFTPLQVKMIITGYGRADKKDVQKTIKNLLNLEEIPRPDDAADALGIAVCYVLNHVAGKKSKRGIAPQ